MLQEFEEDFVYTYLPNITTSKLDAEKGVKTERVSFRQFVEIACAHFTETDVKDEVPAFIPGSFKPKEERIVNNKNSERIVENMDEEAGISALIFDFDDAVEVNGKKPIDNAREVFKDIEYFIHSTHSRTLQTPDKYRMIIKLEHPIPVSQWKSFVNKLIKPLGADSSCSNPSRGFYFPSSIDKNNPENKHKYIKPVSDYHPGQSFTLDMADQIQKDHIEYLRKTGQSEELKKYLLKSSERTQIEGKRHPAGGIVKDNVVHSQVDTSYEAYVKRHMESIKEYLVDGRRHNFALSSIMREFSIYKDMVDVSSLVMFLYKAAEDYSDTYLYMEGSPEEDRASNLSPQDMFSLRNQRTLRNTPDELEEFITSAIRLTSNMSKPESHFTSRLDAAKKAAEIASQTNNWIFRKPKRPAVNNLKQDELSQCLDECKKAIQKFNTCGNWNQFVHEMLDDVAHSSNLEPEEKTKAIRFRCQAIMKTVDDYYRDNAKKLKRGIDKDAFNKQLIVVASEVAGKDKLLKTSILTGFESFKKNMTQLESKKEKSLHP